MQYNNDNIIIITIIIIIKYINIKSGVNFTATDEESV